MRLSIVIVSYNAADHLRQCLDMLQATAIAGGREVIVVDNDSRDGSTGMVEEEFPPVRLIRNKENRGFATACNQGIRVAQGDYILLLNSDARFCDDALAVLVEFLEDHPEVAVVSGRVLNADMSDQGVARAFPTPWNALFGRRSVLTRHFPGSRFAKQYLTSRQNQGSQPFEADWVSGACLMARKNVVEKAGMLDEGFFMYWEDADLCFRIKRQGWKVYCVPQAAVVHYEGGSSPASQKVRLIVEFNRSAYRYYRKHHIRGPWDPRLPAAITFLTVRTLALIMADCLKSWGRPRKDGSL